MIVCRIRGGLQVAEHVGITPTLWRDIEHDFLVRVRYTNIPDFFYIAPFDPANPEVTFYFYLSECDGLSFPSSKVGRRVGTVFHELGHLEHFRIEDQHGQPRFGQPGMSAFVGFDMRRLYDELVANLVSLCSLQQLPTEWARGEFDRRMGFAAGSEGIVQRYLDIQQINKFSSQYSHNPIRFNGGKLGSTLLSPILASELMRQHLAANQHSPMPGCDSLMQQETLGALADWLEQVMGS